MYLGDIYTVAVNLCGLPGITVPCGQDKAGMPIGVQMIGDCFGEHKIFRAAAAYEAERGSISHSSERRQRGMKQYETVIGLEVHVELATKTKIFCGCSTEFGGAPNTHTCPVCTGMPGSLPVLNHKVVEFALKAGIAANCQINQYCKFDRKNYFYPDNPQNYQISQLYLPICHDGWVEIETSAGKKKVRIHEMHMEEDAGKLIHDEWEDCSLVDYNRSGVPLIEIVSEPDMRSSEEEVIAYLEKLRCMMQYLGVSDCKLQEGSMRADVNLSVREVGSETFGTRTEMKNLNSFKAIARAIEGERERQIELIEEEEPLYRKPAAGMTTKNPLMQCVPKRMPKIIVISRIRIFRRSIFPMHGSKRSAVHSRNFEKKNSFVISRNLSFRHTMQESLQNPDIFPAAV